MVLKCVCTNCSGHLAFEEENAGQQIKCPHCGWETTLYDSRFPPTEQEEESEGVLARLRALPRFVKWGAGGVVVLGGIAFAGWEWGFPILQELVPAAESKLGLALLFILVLVAILVLLMWAAFPVVIFLQLRKLTTVVAQLAVNARPALPRERERQEKAVSQPEASKETKAESEVAQQE